MITVKGILSFNDLFVAKPPAKNAEPKFQAVILFPPGDPELERVTTEFNLAKNAAYPSGVPVNSKVCLMKYSERYQWKDYYNPALADWWVLSTTAKASDRPHVVDVNCQDIINNGDKGLVSGMVVKICFGISGYTEGTGGVGGWLNGIMTTDEMGSIGRLDNKASAAQMFGSGGQASAGTPAAPEAPVAPGAPAAPAETHVMTEKAKGVSYDAHLAKGWTDATLIEHGLMVTPSFA